MNGSELSTTALSEVAGLPCQDDERRERQELERWASAVAGCQQAAVPVRPAALGLAGAESSLEVPAGWRPCVDPLTPGVPSPNSGGAAMGPLPAAGGSAADDPQRIQVRVRTEEFGEIAVVIERVEAGLRVLLGAANPKAVLALAQDCLAVRRALESDGQSVGSLEIVRMDGLGTDLALSRSVSSNRARRSQESAQSATDSGQRKKKTKRLDVTG